MRGVDVTPDQIAAADRFLRGVLKSQPPQVPDDYQCTSTWSDMVRLLAWYGAVRYAAGMKGINSVEKPGPTDSPAESN